MPRKTLNNNRRLTQAEIDFIKDNWDKMPLRDMQKALNLSTATIQRWKRKMGLPNLKRYDCSHHVNKFSQYEIDYVRKMYGKIPCHEIAKQLNRSLNSIAKLIHTKLPELKGKGIPAGVRNYPAELRYAGYLLIQLKKKLQNYGSQHQ